MAKKKRKKRKEQGRSIETISPLKSEERSRKAGPTPKIEPERSAVGPAKADPTPKIETTSKTDRRSFLTYSGHIVAGACVLFASVGAVRLAIPDFQEGLPKRFPMGRPADFKMNTLTWLRQRDLFVMRNDAGVGAFSSRCTHLGCTVRRTQDGFTCPCHGATYDPLGEVLTGPARRPLPWYRVWLEPDGRLWTDLSEPLATGGPTPIALPKREAG